MAVILGSERRFIRRHASGKRTLRPYVFPPIEIARPYASQPWKTLSQQGDGEREGGGPYIVQTKDSLSCWQCEAGDATHVSADNTNRPLSSDPAGVTGVTVSTSTRTDQTNPSGITTQGGRLRGGRPTPGSLSVPGPQMHEQKQ